ncbi:hypothetical protein MAPG_00051 [Magnaporthiopsis poae ATCC 64411]|uniref:Heterokaryon incompatibility domain-containing protein n=1 Tax=Magnaporthiopsis poae (strain ATCC 64411 / 73-15) TaxID=644358 RepID=A0A0C4DJZ1_MAGP6|nr:hypothetical protein MAPG_00051 [Magnaporthiopsis poae ATCC 64411]
MASEISPSMCPPPAADAGGALVPDTTSPPAAKHNRDSLSDKELERLTLTLKGERPKSEKASGRRTKAASHWYNRSKWEPSTQTDHDDSFFIALPEVLPEDDAGYLCEMCRHIDFAALLDNNDDTDTQASPRKPLRISISKGLEQVMYAEDNKCCFCRLLREKIVGDGILDGVSEDDIRLGSFYLNLLDDGPDYARRLEVELETGQRAPHVFTVHRIEEDPQRQKPLSGRIVRQDLANMEYLREWLHLCEETHDDPAQGGEGGLDMTSLRLIDTEELRVRQVDMPARYACLSYVWGKGNQVQYTHATRPRLEAKLGLRDDVPPDLPRTIKDAIKMVFSCAHTAAAAMFEESVPSRDPAFRHPAVEDQAEGDLMMRVWRDRSLGRYANKGISMGRDTGDLMFISEELDLENFSIAEQLDKLGPRFEITVDPTPVSFMSLSLSPDIVVVGHDKKPAMTTPWDLYRLAVDDYTKRQLSWDADAVDAFTGVEHIIRRGTNTTFWHGLPSFAFEDALLWQPDDGFLERRRDPKTGAPLFPSWSWAGWRGHVSYRGRGWKNSVVWKPVSVVKWLTRADPEWMVERFKSRAERTEAEVERYRQALAAAGPERLARELDMDNIQPPGLWGQDGWELVREQARNQHLYVNEAHYPGLSFTYPTTLPGQPIEPRQDEEGKLFLLSHAVPVVACDMKPPAPFKPKIEDTFLQIGINDEHRSANYRPPWQRIIYHQGYRAGFLKLDVPCLTSPSPLDAGDDGYEYHLAVIARGSVPKIPPPPTGWDLYWDAEPRRLQWELFGDEWFARRDASELPVQPDETVEPAGTPENENGDPHWDQARFGVQACFDVYDVLLLRTRKEDEVSERVGVGKVNFFAFRAAKPVPRPFRLA